MNQLSFHKKKRSPLKKNTPAAATEPKPALISVVNGAKFGLKVRNNMVSNLGPNKGKWIIHQELVLAPGACATTTFFPDATHQLMVYNAPTPEQFLYKISGSEIENNQTVELFHDSYNIVPNLMCI